MDDFATTHDLLRRTQRRALVVGAAGVVALAIGACFDATQVLRSWLVAWLFALGLSLGGLALVLLHAITGGAWGVAIRRFVEAAMHTTRWLALGFVPLALGMHRLYGWSRSPVEPEFAPEQPQWLNTPGFLVRALVCFLAWIGVAWVIGRRTRQQDVEATLATERKLRVFAGPAVLIYGLTMTVASIDWVMSLEPHWRSTIYGVIFLVGQALTAFAFVIVAAVVLRGHSPFKETFSRQNLQDLGSLTLAFVLLWTYVGYSQYLIIWSANLPEEATWYVRRLGGGWRALATVLVLLHFVVPFVVLLSRKAKENARILGVVAGGMLVMRWVDLFWLVTPSFHESLSIHWQDVAALVAAAGLWTAAWIRELRRRPLTPPPVVLAPVAQATVHG
jgi:hypothetical protein